MGHPLRVSAGSPRLSNGGCSEPAAGRGRLGLLGASALALALWDGSGQGASAQEREPHVLAAIWENDLLFAPAIEQHQDRHYTQGAKLIYLERGEPVAALVRALWLDRLADSLPRFGLEPVATSYGFVFGQNIYTPEDNRATNIVANDRPYAGWLYGGLALQRRGATPGGHPVMESWELNLGVIGPEAQGEWAQNTVHRWRRFETFDGWGNQLDTEPAFVLKYGRAWRWTLEERSARYFDLIPHGGVQLGTVMVAGELGATMRVGWRLPQDFGPQTIDSPLLISDGPRGLGIYAFGRVTGRVVGRNAFLDGNLVHRSHRVDKEPFVADFSYGLVALFGRHCELSWTFITRTREFRGQLGNDQFGSVAGRLRWGF